MTWYLTKHKDNFAISLYFISLLIYRQLLVCVNPELNQGLGNIIIVNKVY
jgi:hypothetical protein